MASTTTQHLLASSVSPNTNGASNITTKSTGSSTAASSSTTLFTGSPAKTTGVVANVSSVSTGSPANSTGATTNPPTGNSTATSGSPTNLTSVNSSTTGSAGSSAANTISTKSAVAGSFTSSHTVLTNRLSTTPSQTGAGHCGNPPPIANGQVTSKGPYAPGTAAMYTCSTGFTLVGQLVCRADLTWPGSVPQCVTANSSALGEDGKEAGDHNVYVGNGVPLWLAIVLGLTFGVLCLVMLTCLVMYCLRICGCYKRSLIGDVSATGAVVPGHTGDARDARGIHEVSTVHKGTAMSVVELEPFDGYRTVTTEGRPPEDNRYHFTRDTRKGAQHPRRTNRFWEDSETSGSNQPAPRRKAKLPDKPTWMPHSQQRRKINTSTQ